IYVQFFCCLLMLLFFIIIKPFNQRILNAIEIFNEVTLLLCSYCLFCFTEFVPDVQTRYKFGWGFIGIITINIVVSMIILLYNFFSTIFISIRRFIIWKRM